MNELLSGSHLAAYLKPSKDNPILGYYGSEVDELTVDIGNIGYCTGLIPCDFYGSVFSVNGSLWDCFVPIDSEHKLMVMEVFIG